MACPGQIRDGPSEEKDAAPVDGLPAVRVALRGCARVKVARKINGNRYVLEGGEKLPCKPEVRFMPRLSKAPFKTGSENSVSRIVEAEDIVRDEEAVSPDEVAPDVLRDEQLPFEESFVVLDARITAGKTALDEGVYQTEKHPDECLEDGQARRSEIGRGRFPRINVPCLAKHSEKDGSDGVFLFGSFCRSRNTQCAKRFRKDFDLMSIIEGDDADVVSHGDHLADSFSRDERKDRFGVFFVRLGSERQGQFFKLGESLFVYPKSLTLR